MNVKDSGHRLTAARASAIALGLLVSALGVSAGCNRHSTATDSGSALTTPAPATSAPAGSPAGVPAAASHLDIGTGTSLTATPDLDSQIAKIEKGGGSKERLSVLYSKRGMERMMDPQASPHLKYPAALKDFRRAEKLDPHNSTAVSNVNLIESIYQSMGRPIPSS